MSRYVAVPVFALTAMVAACGRSDRQQTTSTTAGANPPVVSGATTGNDSKWPEIIEPGNYNENALNLERNHILDNFLIKNNYREVWENIAFKILIPGNQPLAKF